MIREWVIQVDSGQTTFPDEPQVVIPFTPDSVAVRNKTSDDGGAGDTIHLSDGPHKTDDLTVEASGSGQAIAWATRQTKFYFRCEGNGGGKVIFNASKAK